MINGLRKHSGVAFLLVLATMAVYSATFGHELLTSWDDHYYLVVNPTIRGITPAHLKEAFSSYFIGNYAPLHIISYMIDYEFWGLDPLGYHLKNVAIHAVNGVLVYLLLIRLETGRFPASIAAGLFLLHPVQVESVAWVAQRKNLLAMLFFLFAWHCYLSYRRSTTKPVAWYMLTLVAFILALLSKSITIIFPFVVLLQDHCFPQGNRRSAGLAAKLPFLLVAAGAAYLTIASQSPELGGGRRDYPGGSITTTILTMLPVLASYIGDCFWPLDLLPYYMVKIRSHADATVLLASLFAATLLASGCFLWRRNRRLFFYYAFFFLVLVPVSQIVPLLTLKNDRYLYFPMIGFAGLFAESLCLLSSAFAPRGRVIVIVTIMLLLALPALSIKQTMVWKNDLELWRHAVARDPENMMGWLQLTKEYTARGDITDAVHALNSFDGLKARYGPIRGYSE